MTRATGRSTPGQIITFYSYKGGTGRTMALANTAWILASTGLRVLAVDWDLESPGLHRYFHPFLLDKQLRSLARGDRPHPRLRHRAPIEPAYHGDDPVVRRTPGCALRGLAGLGSSRRAG